LSWAENRLGEAPDPRAEPGWAAGLPEASPVERRLIEGQIGREVRGAVAVAARCRYGLPTVVRTSPFLPDGTPFPTLYWLSCPAAGVAVGRLEASGWNASLSQRVATEPELAAAHLAAHEQYLAQRDTLCRISGDPGVGGLPGRVKCLHALYAHELATGADPVGRIVRQVVDPIDCPGPCVDLSADRPGAGRAGGGRRSRGMRPREEAERLAAVDVGTNSTRLVVADVAGDRVVEQHAREMVITRLGKGVDRAKRFDPAAVERTVEVLAGYAELCARLGVEATRVVATSATRDAANREELLGAVRRLFGVEAEVLTGDQEAAITYAGATHDLPGEERTLVVDIGGGSTEFIIGNREPAAMVSVDIGCVRLFERHLASDPPAPQEVAALRRDVREHLWKVRKVLDPSSAQRVVGVAGTVTTVTAIALDLDVYDPERIHRSTVDAWRITETAKRLAAMTIAERAALPVMAKGREDVIAAGALALDEICRTFGFQRMIASETDILDGVLLGLARRRSRGG
jgi:exopolyphosphatase/guanosine-5'-triphosphate,3'-diphosphate pyrophosphatase